MVQEISVHPIPGWLDSPPDTYVPAPPVETRPQTLPFHKLTWENFERLILRLVRRERTVAGCWQYGERGQKQYGLDILAELVNSQGEYSCYQCKRVKEFSATEIKKTVDKFLEGKWAGQTKIFILCTSSPLINTQQVEEIVEQRKRLNDRGIVFETWDGSEAGQLSERLKQYPELVDDFFDREWVRLFNGKENAEKLGDKLDANESIKLRNQLQKIYSTLFHQNDPGLRFGIGTRSKASLMDRYVTPSILEELEVVTSERTIATEMIAPREQTSSEEQGKQKSNRSAIGIIRGYLINN